jgi:hypothetical protein
MDARPIPVKAKSAPKKKPAYLGFLHGLRKPAAVEAPTPVTPIADPLPPEPSAAPAPRKPIDYLLGVK